MKVAIVGFGFVGEAMYKLFPEAYIYEVDRTKYAWEPYKEGVNECDVAFICVPTPKDNMSDVLDTSIVEEVVQWCTSPLIVIRSTLNPGTADYLEKTYRRNIAVVPEYIGETIAHPLLDEKTRPFLIIGGQPATRRKVIDVFQTVYNANISIRQMTNYEAEICKLTENRAIGWKVMQMHELYLACEAAGADYYLIRDAVYGDDPRFNLWFTFPFPGNLGFDSSRCLKKDIPAWCAWAESVGFTPEITKLLIEKSRDYENNCIDQRVRNHSR